MLKEAAANGDRVKVAGTGHSFTDIACTDGVLLRLFRHCRILDVDRDARTVTVEGGLTLEALAERLAEQGLALSNLGDIGYQTVAGAISTGTHGTGGRFGNLATQVVGVRLLLADGSVVECSAERDREVFKAAQVGLGALGVISQVTLQCEDAFNLHAVEEPQRLDEVLDSFSGRVQDNEHFEFFWFPHTDRVFTKTNNRTHRPLAPKGRFRTWFDDMFLANHVFGLVSRVVKRVPSLTRPLARVAGSALGRSEEVDRSDRVFLTPRLVPFVEMEYAIPREAAPQSVRAVRDLIDGQGLLVNFPVEARAVAADDIFLSPSYGRDTAYVAVHMFRGTDYETYFRGVEAIMKDLDGRPHWGKLHWRTAEDLRPAYPEFDRFLSVRDRLDPNRRFANGYLERVLGA